MNNFTFNIPSVRGTQNKRMFYQATVPFRTLASLLKLDDAFNATDRSQRLVNKPRARKFANYLKRNKDGFFVVPPLVGFVQGGFEFEEVPLEGFANVGRLVVPLDSKIMLFDGQHRAYGIREGMEICPELADQQVSIMFFADMSLSERKQAFHDINFTQKTPPAALCIAYNGRDEFDSSVVDILSTSNIRGHVEYEANSVSGDNANFYSLKTFKDFFVNFSGKDLQHPRHGESGAYVDELFKAVNLPAMLLSSLPINTAKELRDQMVVGHGVMLQAFGLLGAGLITQYPSEWAEKLQALGDMKIWYKDDEQWLDRCVNSKGKMLSNKLAVRLTSYQLLRICGAPLTPEARAEERANHLGSM